MSEKQTPVGTTSWMTGGMAPAMMASQFMMDAAMRFYLAGQPIRMLMGSAPFAVAGWMLSQMQPRPILFPPDMRKTSGPKRTDGASDAEIVTTPPRRATPRMTLVVTEPRAKEPEFPRFEDVARVESVVDFSDWATPVTATALPPDAPIADRPTALSEAPAEGGDDLKRIKGVGTKLAAQLNGLGYYRFYQIAAWGEAELAWVDLNLLGFSGRATRDDWIGQAKALMAKTDSGE